jgi:hypothetical protein
MQLSPLHNGRVGFWVNLLCATPTGTSSPAKTAPPGALGSQIFVTAHLGHTTSLWPTYSRDVLTCLETRPPGLLIPSFAVLSSSLVSDGDPCTALHVTSCSSLGGLLCHSTSRSDMFARTLRDLACVNLVCVCGALEVTGDVTRPCFRSRECTRNEARGTWRCSNPVFTAQPNVDEINGKGWETHLKP